MRGFAATATDVVVIFVFLALGAALPLDELRHDGLPALATVTALIILARPLAVLASRSPIAALDGRTLFVASRRQSRQRCRRKATSAAVDRTLMRLRQNGFSTRLNRRFRV